MKKQLLLNTEVKTGIKPQNDDGSAAIAGPIFNRTNFLSAILHGAVGDVTGTPTGLDATFTVYHGDTVNDEEIPTSITDEEATGFVLTLADVQSGNAEDFVNINLEGLKKWIRVDAELTFTEGTSPAADVSSSLVLGDPRYTENVTSANNE
ncbi:MAG: hypothetical protein FH761_16630 [Firmicutes bacterium]|nr:hypothetical protein [Bacillota bacterium]